MPEKNSPKTTSPDKEEVQAQAVEVESDSDDFSKNTSRSTKSKVSTLTLTKVFPYSFSGRFLAKDDNGEFYLVLRDDFRVPVGKSAKVKPESAEVVTNFASLEAEIPNIQDLI